MSTMALYLTQICKKEKYEANPHGDEFLCEQLPYQTKDVWSGHVTKPLLGRQTAWGHDQNTELYSNKMFFPSTS